jgi:hypothetical protein
MTKAEYTPGPWEIDDTAPNSYLRIIGNIDGDAYDDGSPRHIYTHVCDVLDNEQEEANARLIAAAPELLDALEESILAMQKVYDQSEMAHVVMDELERAKAVIAKARGEKEMAA